MARTPTPLRRPALLMALLLALALSALCGAGTSARPATATATASAAGLDLARFLQNEQVAVGAAHQRLVEFLRSKRISIGSDPQPTALPVPDGAGEDDMLSERVTVSSDEHPIECRISLDTVPSGTVCIAPCGCSGSQKWVQFSVLNKLRRADAAKWRTCQTCRQPIALEPVLRHSSPSAALLGLLLDRPAVLRSLLVLVLAAAAWAAALPSALSAALISRTVWQSYPHWSKLTRLPLVLKFWLARLALGELAARLATAERRWVIEPLAACETTALERSLPSSRQ